MPRTLLLAAALTASTASYAVAQPTLYRWQWDGSIRVVNETPECGGKFLSDENARARYQPKIPDVPGRKSSLTIFRKNETEMIQNDDSYDQFHGEGDYNRFTIGDGINLRLFDGGEEYYQSYEFTQTPSVVTESTNFVTLLGTLENYADIEDCTVTLRGTFVGVDSVNSPPPPPYGGG